MYDLLYLGCKITENFAYTQIFCNFSIFSFPFHFYLFRFPLSIFTFASNLAILPTLPPKPEPSYLLSLISLPTLSD